MLTKSVRVREADPGEAIETGSQCCGRRRHILLLHAHHTGPHWSMAARTGAHPSDSHRRRQQERSQNVEEIDPIDFPLLE